MLIFGEVGAVGVTVAEELLPFVCEFPGFSGKTEEGVGNGFGFSGTGTWVDGGNGSVVLIVVEGVGTVVVGFVDDGDGDNVTSVGLGVLVGWVVGIKIGFAGGGGMFFFNVGKEIEEGGAIHEVVITTSCAHPIETWGYRLGDAVGIEVNIAIPAPTARAGIARCVIHMFTQRFSARVRNGDFGGRIGCK